MPTLREWRVQAQAGVLDPLYVEHLRTRHVRGRTHRGKKRWANRASRMNYRARLAGASGRVNADDLILLVMSYGSRCAYCGWPLDFTGARHLLVAARRGTFDHVRPLSRGGRGDVSNLVPSCSPCNYERSGWPDAALGVPAPRRFVLDQTDGGRQRPPGKAESPVEGEPSLGLEVAAASLKR